MKVSWVASPWTNTESGPKTRRPSPQHRAGLIGLARLLKASEGDVYSPAQVPLPAITLHALGDALMRVVNGEDARHVFCQTGARGRSERRLEQQHVGRIYWFELLKGSSEAEAVKSAAAWYSRKFSGKPLTRSSVRQYAKKYARVEIESMSRNASLRKLLTPEQIAANREKLLKRIERGAKRGTW